MPERPSDVEKPPLTLIERKQRAARSRIIDAADALFAERGFDNVSVTDIAERAEVGRTTFFRHFGDKTEVVFAKERAMFDAIADAASEEWPPTRSVGSLRDALSALEPLVIDLCRKATSDPAAFERRSLLLDAHEELRARDALKNRLLANELANVLLAHGASSADATVAAQLAVACYESGRVLATDPSDLVAKTRAAFRATLAIGSAAADA